MLYQNYTKDLSSVTTELFSRNSWLEISTSAFNHNVSYYKQLIGHQNILAAVIKSNGYGHGLVQMAKLCQNNSNVEWLCVAQLSEGLIIRNNGITKPILVLGYADVDVAYAVDQNIDFMVDSLEYAQQLNTVGIQYHHCFNVHIKIDTGLSRFGIFPHQAVEFTQQLQKLSWITIKGVYSHFIASNDNPALTMHQQSIFSDTVQAIFEHTKTIDYIHMSNSASIMTQQHPSFFNFFRIGLGMYGYCSQESSLKPVLTWKTCIVHIKTVPAHTYVSYACAYKTMRTTRIALLPVGYSDGYDIRYSNKTGVYVNNSYAPVIGRIAMNMMMVDITNCTANSGDEVILLGNYPTITAQDLSRLANIPNVREILTRINPQLLRTIAG